MNTKRIVFATLMALAPFVANATQTVVETNTPAAVGANGTIKIANADAPFERPPTKHISQPPRMLKGPITTPSPQ